MTEIISKKVPIGEQNGEFYLHTSGTFKLTFIINEYMLELTDNLNNEDKQIGVYFVDKTGMRKEEASLSSEEDTKKFAYKVLEYLWDDVSKFARDKWFKEDIKSLDQLVEEYLKSGTEVFSDGVKSKLNK